MLIYLGTSVILLFEKFSKSKNSEFYLTNDIVKADGDDPARAILYPIIPYGQ